jgi:uncharacterized membrane protein YraQ (UPF0718 family)/copper chaperone CopZ
MIPTLLEGIFKETLRLFIEISPYLILGFLFAGLLHTLLGESYIKKHFAVSGLSSSVKAAVFGIPLPICSCGVIPLAESLRKDGASKSATISFLVSTPTSGVDSIFATYALLGPVYAIFRPIASFFSGIMVGLMTHWQDRNGSLQEARDTGSKSNSGAGEKKSFKEAFNYGFKEIPAGIASWLIIGVLIGGAISALVPADFGAKYLHSPVLTYIVILLISIPIYVCATGSIPIAASLIAKGVLPGAALAFLIAGPATNTVTISFLTKKMGAKITALYIISIITVSVLCGLLFDWIWQIFTLNLDSTIAGGTHLPMFIKYASALLMAGILIFSKLDSIKKYFSRNKTRRDSTRPVIEIVVPDMTCQHCQVKLTKALQGIPEIETLSVDLSKKRIEIQGNLEKSFIIQKIKNEGYNPE